MPRRIQRHRPARPNAFSTIMILMLLVLILVLVLTYLRTMRAYTITHPILQPSADVVLVRLQSDLAGIIGADGKIDEHEPHDYPWTCARMNAPCALSYPEMVSSTQGLGDPKVDDAWLAPNEPEGNQWKQVSNIYNSFLAYDHANLSNIPMNTATQAWVPSDVPAGATIQGMANAAQSGLPPTSPASTSLAAQFQNVPLDDPRLVDADGDGVPDSLWFYPKDNLQGGLRYVAAVRVVDLCGCLNLNTALGEFGAAPGTVGGDIPKKGEGSYEIDASPLLGAMPAASQTFRNAGGDAYGRWLANGAKTANSGLSYGDDGVGTKINTTTTTAPVTRTGIRYDLNDELQLKDFSNRITAAFAPQPVLGAHYPALNLTQVNPVYPAVTDYAVLAADVKLRHQLTTLSGVSDRYAALPSAPDGDYGSLSFNRTRRPFDIYTNQLNINQPAPPAPYPAINDPVNPSTNVSPFTYKGAWDQAHFSDATTWAGVALFLRGISGYNNLGNTAYPYPQGFVTLMGNATEGTRALNYAVQMGPASFQDALTRDNLTSVANSWMGWQPLPIMTEFYAEMPYVVMAPNSNLPKTPSAPVVVFPNTTLASLDIAKIRNLAGKLNYSGYPIVRSDVHAYKQTASSITFQYQHYYPDNYTRVAGVRLVEDGANNVVADQVYSKYKVGNNLGQDFDTLAGTTDSNYTAILGLPVQAADLTWTQVYSNLAFNRTATGGAGTSTGEFVLGGNNLTSTSWLASCSAGVPSYAIELVNPYSIPIRVANIRFNFRAHDWKNWDTRFTTKVASTPNYASADLSTYINAAPPTGMSQDAEGYYVLRPGEKIVFYRNGTELAGPGGARRRPFGGPAYVTPPAVGTPGSTDISSRIPSGPGIYKVNLGTGSNAPDLGGYPSAWNVAAIDIESACKWANGAPVPATDASYGWMNCQRLVFQPLHSGWDVATATPPNCAKFETNVPDGRQGAPGDLVYKQIDARTFGVGEKLNVLQARPALFPMSASATTGTNQMPKDMGDEELRTNTYGSVGSGVLHSGGVRPYPDGTTQTISGISLRGRINTPGTFMPLGHANPDSNPVSAAPYAFLDYDDTNAATNSISALGMTTKVAFPGNPLYPDPLGTTTLNGATYASYAGNRQSIKNENWTWNYVGIPGDANYPGTFPELTAANNANRARRDNGSAIEGTERRDGLRPLDLLTVPLVSPIYNNWAGPGGAFRVGNNAYRGTNINTGWDSNSASPSPLVGNLTQNTIGDALNFYLTQDAAKQGLRGLCLRTDVPWFDWVNAQSPTTPKYPALPYNSTTNYAANQEALYGGEVYQAQAAGTKPAPNPALDGTGNVGPGLDWKLSNGPYARASQFWQASWAEVLASRWQVDSPKYKGKTPANGDDWKPGMINLNTAPKAVLKCLSLPNQPGTATPVDADTVVNAIIAARSNPTAGSSVAGGVRKGLVLASEAFGPQGLKSYTTDAALTGGAGTSKFYTSDVNLNLDTLSWLPQQATCRSDTFCAYIIVQGYKADDFNKGPVDVRRAVVLYSRNTSGGVAKILSTSVVPSK